MNKTLIMCAGCIDLPSTLNCGQAFRWTVDKEGTGYIGELHGAAVRVSELNDGLLLETEGDIDKVAGYAREYFDTERDYVTVAKQYEAEPWVKAAFLAYPGLRVLRQPVFETVITFIISANNNTGRIERIVRRLCERFGKRLECAWEIPEAVYTFPEPEDIAMAAEDDLRDMGMGYRVPYVRETAKMVAGGFPLDTLASLTYDEAHKALLALPGVGDKVADCVLLFSCGHINAIPVDVWVERVLRTGFFPEISGRKNLKRAAMQRFGEYGGIAQQVLFHAARRGELPL